MHDELMSFLTVEEFQEWLQDQTPSAVVGKMGEPDQARADVCPLATCLNALRPEPEGWSVGMDFFSLKKGDWWLEWPRNMLPTWASNFTRIVDGTYPETVTRDQALECLERAKARSGL